MNSVAKGLEGWLPHDYPKFHIEDGCMQACALKGMQREVVVSLANTLCTRKDGEPVQWACVEDDEDQGEPCDGSCGRIHYYLYNQLDPNLQIAPADETGAEESE